MVLIVIAVTTGCCASGRTVISIFAARASRRTGRNRKMRHELNGEDGGNGRRGEGKRGGERGCGCCGLKLR